MSDPAKACLDEIRAVILKARPRSPSDQLIAVVLATTLGERCTRRLFRTLRMPRDMTAREYRAINQRHALALDTIYRYGFRDDPGAEDHVSCVTFIGEPVGFDTDTGYPSYYTNVAMRAVSFRKERARLLAAET